VRPAHPAGKGAVGHAPQTTATHWLENFAEFRRLHPALSTLKIEDMVPSEAVMVIHPGALNYYREAGLVHQR
jgi:TRAP-type uncharacterized transport system substrate-binding protein